MNYPFKMFAVKGEKVARFASPGTTEQPTVVGYTRNDISVWAKVVARSLTKSSVRRVICCIMLTDMVFTGGLGITTDVNGCTVVRFGMTVDK